MSDSSDDDVPIALKKRKIETESGSAKLPSRQSKEKVSYKEDSDDDFEEPSQPEPKSKAKGAAKPAKATSAAKSEPAKKRKAPVKKEFKSAPTGTPTVKREKKVYDNVGQTRDTPDETDPLRRFYSSLFDQKPESMMAKKWLCIHGLLSEEDAQAYLAEVGKNVKSPEKKSVRRTPAAKSGAKSSKAPASKTTPKRKPKKEESSDDDSEEEFIINKKPATKKPAAKKGAPSKPKLTGDAVFQDGGLDGSSSDDDIPLAKRAA